MPMRLVHVTAADFTLAIFLRAQLEALRDQGHEVHTVSSAGPLLEGLRRDGFTCHEVPIPRSPHPTRILGAARRLRALFRRERYDVVHVHTPIAAAAARVAARLAGVPHALYTAHGFYFHDNMPRLPYRVHVLIERLMGRLTSHLFVQSREDYDAALRLGIAPADRVTYIGNGVDERRFSLDRMGEARAPVREALGYTEADFVFAYAGRIVREKGVGDLVSAAASICAEGLPARFLIIGANAIGDRDPFARDIQERVSAGDLRDRFHFTGFTDDVPPYLAASDAFVLPSYREGLPRSIIEAMHLGLPVISTDIRGPREEVEEGVTGQLVPPRDPEALARAMARLLADRERARRMGMEGRRRARAEFCEHQVVARVLEVYRGIEAAETAASRCA
jgi:glycosyltransferase involved in cell wall biosynthesis